MNRLFVYGTLRLGEGNEMAMTLAKRARHAGFGKTRGRLFRVTHFPALTEPRCDDEWATGEVFEDVPDDLLQTLDQYEGADYARQFAEVTLPDGRTLQACLYRWLSPTDGLDRLPSGDWLK